MTLKGTQPPLRPRSVTKALAWHGAGAVGATDLLLCVTASLADEDVRHVGFSDLGAREVNPGGALVALYHGSPGKRL